MQPLAEAPTGNPAAGLGLAAVAAGLFAVGAVLQHEAAELSTTARGLNTATALEGVSLPGYGKGW
jgi:hypothetical protein